MQKAFTLIELMLYAAIVAMVLIFVTGFLWNIVLDSIKEASFREVQQNAEFALFKINQEIKKATGINSPVPGESANTLSLSMANAHLDPTIFDVAEGKIRITQGSAGSFEITNNQVSVDNLQFTNFSYAGTPGTIQVEMTVNHVNPSTRTEYDASVSLESSITLASGGAVTVSPHLAQLHYRWRNDDGGE